MNFFMALDGDIVLLRRQGFYKCYGNLLSKISQINFTEVEVASGGYLKLNKCPSLYFRQTVALCTVQDHTAVATVSLLPRRTVQIVDHAMWFTVRSLHG